MMSAEGKRGRGGTGKFVEPKEREGEGPKEDIEKVKKSGEKIVLEAERDMSENMWVTQVSILLNTLTGIILDGRPYYRILSLAPSTRQHEGITHNGYDSIKLKHDKMLTNFVMHW